jgi:ribonuclease HII
MDPTFHTLIAVGCIAGAFYAGRIIATKNLFEDVACKLLDKLENDGYIAVKKDKDGEKDLIPISSIIAKATRDALKAK